MSEIRFRTDCTATLVNAMATDYMVVDAARISTATWHGMTGEHDWERDKGLISYLMKNRHGTPFEHNAFTWRVECPIFVAREFMRHRIASFNEESGRYKQLEGVFWVPCPARGLVQEGKPGHYIMKPGTLEQYNLVLDHLTTCARECYTHYEAMLAEGITREVARAALPVAIYTSFYVTMNARGLMNFLSLRIDDPDAAYPSKPQYEIQTVAEQMETEFAKKMPLTYHAYIENGRVCP